MIDSITIKHENIKLILSFPSSLLLLLLFLLLFLLFCPFLFFLFLSLSLLLFGDNCDKIVYDMNVLICGIKCANPASHVSII